MRNANDLAKAAIEMGQLAERIKPEDSNPFAPALKLAQFHLIAASRRTREVAEAMTEKAHAAS